MSARIPSYSELAVRCNELAAQRDELAAALEAAEMVVSDRAAGGRMLTSPETAQKIADQIRAALASANGEPA